MDRNLLMAFALSFLVLALWSSFQAPPVEEPGTPRGEEVARQEQGQPEWETEPSRAPEASPGVPAPDAAARRVEGAASAPAVPSAPAAGGQQIRVAMPLYEATLTTSGGGLIGWSLIDYRETRDPTSPMLDLSTVDATREVALATPFAGLGLGDLSFAPYQSFQPDSRTVVFEREQEGITLRKTYRFDEESYEARLTIDVENHSDRTVQPEFGLVWPGRKVEGGDFVEHGLTVMYQGSLERTRWSLPAAMACAPGGGFGDHQTFEDGVEWAGEETRYFIAAVIPEVARNASTELIPGADGESGAALLRLKPTLLQPGQSVSKDFRLYVGPKIQERLAAVGAGLPESVNVGWSWVAPLARFFNWLLSAFYSVIPNYGLAIILITLLVRVVTAPLTQRQMRSMKRMGELQPKIKELQEKYKDDRQRQSQEMMSLYKQAGVNPLGGCLPMLLQFPVFIGLFYALQGNIELRQAPFIGWINDLSVPETLFVVPGADLPVRLLPILMGVSMVAQQKLTPSTMDPAQARMMMTIMPVMFTFLFYQFPSGLVLYWFVSNLLAIGHQLLTNRGKSKPAAA